MHDFAVIEDRSHPKNRAASAVALATGGLVWDSVATNDYAEPSREEALESVAAVLEQGELVAFDRGVGGSNNEAQVLVLIVRHNGSH
jgi:hypothetical protein